MPYLKESRREEFPLLDQLCDQIQGKRMVSGDLNFIFSKICIAYFRNEERGSYQALNDITGALDNAKMEFYRRVAVDLEESRIVSNGDIY